jgi:hypothetical protein
MERQILQYIKELKIMLAAETNLEYKHNIQMSLLHLRQSLEEEMLKTLDLIDLVA